MATPTKENFEIMLAKDKKIFETLASIEIFLRHPKAKSNPRYAEISKKYEELKARYANRQDDYKNNSLYKLGTTITEYSDKTVQWFKDKWNSFFSGLGAAPLVVPVAIAAGATITAGAIAYFIYKYFAETNTDYVDALKVIEEVAKYNPDLAEAMLKDLKNVKAKETDSGLFNQLGKGLNRGITVIAVGVTLIGGYKVAKHYKWI